jgi:DNA repair protein RadC
MAGRKSALANTSRPYLPDSKSLGRYLLKEWREFPTKSAFGILALDDTDHTQFMRILSTRPSIKSLECDPQEIVDLVRKSGASKFCLWITHPDGNAMPHMRDSIGLPRIFREMCGSEFLDFLVIGYESFYSWAVHDWALDDYMHAHLARIQQR